MILLANITERLHFLDRSGQNRYHKPVIIQGLNGCPGRQRKGRTRGEETREPAGMGGAAVRPSVRLRLRAGRCGTGFRRRHLGLGPRHLYRAGRVHAPDRSAERRGLFLRRFLFRRFFAGGVLRRRTAALPSSPAKAGWISKSSRPALR